MKILTGIVTYNPDIKRLHENIAAIAPQTETVVIADNGSDNISEISSLAKEFHAFLLSSKTNKGIAAALKEIMSYASINGYEWVLTMDQDSVARSNLIDLYRPYLNNSSIGALTCIFQDRNYHTVTPDTSEPTTNVDFCITSGCLMRVSAYKDTPGYDPHLFIDMVDTDICYALKDAGYSILRINRPGILHELGNGVRMNFFGRTVAHYNHPAWRRYYMARNSIYVPKKHPLTCPQHYWFHLSLKQSILVFLYEDKKFKKLTATIKGYIDGLRMSHTLR